MKTLKTIQVFAKIGKILSTVIYICSIIGAAGCTVGLLSLPFSETPILKIGGMTVRGLIINKSGVDLMSLYPIISGALIICIGEAVVAKFAQLYFKRELADGTPFTVDGAREMLRLGIITICVPLGALILSQIVSTITAEFTGGEVFKLDGGDSITTGVMFIIISVLCRYGAEILNTNNENGGTSNE